jgi:DNA polymerase-3 subunit delta'
MFDLIDAHAPLWVKINQFIQKDRVPQSLLFIGPRHARILQFVNRLVALLICEAESPPCGKCRACHLLKQGIHPDINYIRPEGTSGAIRVDQIRELQQNSYQTPQRGARRFIVIEPADKMNISAANSLLKILEEPPTHTSFILIAEQISSIPATILSRCQKYSLDIPSNQSFDYLTIGEHYPKDSPRGILFQKRATIVTELCEVIEQKTSLCTVAARWFDYAFDDLLWLLYLLTAQAIRHQLMREKGIEPIYHFAHLLSPVILLNQLEQINALTRKINHNINMNQTLVLENLLLGYLSK